MSDYLQRLVRRTGAEAAPAVPLVPATLRESGERPDFDPFAVAAEPAQALAAPRPSQPVPRTESVPPILAPVPAPVSAYTRPFRAEPPPTAVPPAAAQSFEVPPPPSASGEDAEPVVAPPDEIHLTPRAVRGAARFQPPAVERLEPSRRQPPGPADDLTVVRVPPGRQSRTEEGEQQRADEPRSEDRRELEPPEPPALLSRPVQRLEPPAMIPPSLYPLGENPPEAEPDSPRLVIDRLQVDVVPVPPPGREVVRVVSRAVTGAARSPVSASKLRFGLGQM